MSDLTKAQRAALKQIQRRDYPAGEPRSSWINAATLRVVIRLGLVVERPDSLQQIWGRTSHILDLTPAGRSALGEKGS